MSIDFLRSTSTTNPSFRLLFGELIVDDKWRILGEIFLACVREGSITFETKTEVISFKKGDLFFIAPNCKFKVNKSNEAVVDVLLLNLDSPGTNVQEYIPRVLVREIASGSCTQVAKISADQEGHSKIIADFYEIKKAEVERYKHFELISLSKLYDMFYSLLTFGVIEVMETNTQGKKNRALHRVIEYVNNNFCETITLDSIAEGTNMSRYYVSHLFKELMHTTFINYLNELRLSRAAMLLATTDTPIIEIAGLSGFNNISNFNRAFKMRYNITPSKYRKNVVKG